MAESKDFEFDPEVHDFWDAFFYLAFYHDESFDTFLTRWDCTLQRFPSFDLEFTKFERFVLLDALHLIAKNNGSRSYTNFWRNSIPSPWTFNLTSRR